MVLHSELTTASECVCVFVCVCVSACVYVCVSVSVCLCVRVNERDLDCGNRKRLSKLLS